MTEPVATTITMPELIGGRAVDDPDHVALVADGVRSLTLGEWERRSGAVANRLRHRGVERGERVALRFEETCWIGYAIGNLAIHMSGATAVGMPPRLPADQLRRRLEHCGVVGLLHSAGVDPPDFAGWTMTVQELERDGLDRPEVGVCPDDLAEIIYTSGTTGDPKPIAVSHANLTFGHAVRSQLFQDIHSILCAVPIGTNAGHSALMLAMTASCTIHVLTRLDSETIARMIEGLRVELAILPPPTAMHWVAGGVPDRYDLSSLTTLMLGSAPVPLATVSKLSQMLPKVRMLIGYGSTESAPAFIHLPVSSWSEHNDPDFYQQPRMASLGAPRGGTELMIVGADGSPVPPGQLGEICLRSQAPQRGYYGDPAATARVFMDGWTRMGDLGHVDRDGFLYFFDRATDVIHCQGRELSSLRVEGALHWHPEVVEAAAFGLPDPVAGQCVAVAVVLRSPVPVGDLQAFLADRLAAPELPARIFVVDSLPRGTIGKALKRQLRERFGRA